MFKLYYPSCLCRHSCSSLLDFSTRGPILFQQAINSIPGLRLCSAPERADVLQASAAAAAEARPSGPAAAEAQSSGPAAAAAVQAEAPAVLWALS